MNQPLKFGQKGEKNLHNFGLARFFIQHFGLKIVYSKYIY